jgi:hypothetical protein
LAARSTTRLIDAGDSGWKMLRRMGFEATAVVGEPPINTQARVRTLYMPIAW